MGAGIPGGRIRKYALENIVYRWAQRDAKAAAAWLQRWPEGPDRDAALYAGAGSLVQSNPELAARWAEAIGEDWMRHRQMERIAGQWLKSDLKQASEWILNSKLPQWKKEQLLAAAIQ